MDEIWKEIPNTDYSVSDQGRVASRRRGKLKMLRPCAGGSGYLGVWICEDGKQRRRTVHSLVAEAFLGPRPTPKHQVNHIDGVRTNPRVDNLEWVTASGNQRHRFDVLKHAAIVLRGETNGRAKVTETDVREIRARCAAGELQRVVAADYGIARCTVGAIATGKKWVWLI